MCIKNKICNKTFSTKERSGSDGFTYIFYKIRQQDFIIVNVMQIYPNKEEICNSSLFYDENILRKENYICLIHE